ncbi:MAG: DUF3800 domain-containing protein [candidate division WOR-3 bacterium]|nr:DUF3800 domain-containing protein [candidate division WOR-3 bacterium]
MSYKFFLDETGDHGLTFVDKNFPIFLLCGCIFEEQELIRTESKINDFKFKYFNTNQVILHSREIRKCEGAFQILFDLSVKQNFYNDLNQILSNSNFCIIGAGIQKEEHIKKYGKGAKDPYNLSLSFVLERLIFYLDQKDKNATVEIFVEERGKREDQLLLSHFNHTLDTGTYYVSPERLKTKIKKFSFFSKRDNIIGLQIADLCAYPLARYLLNPEEPYIPFNVIKDKLYCDKHGRIDGWGLKLFP